MMGISSPFAIVVFASFILGRSLAFSSSPMHVSVVTGGSGYVGRELVYELLDQAAKDSSSQQPHHKILSLVRASKVDEETQYWKDHASNVNVLPYDMLDGGKTICDALETTKDGDKVVVFHVASVFGPAEAHKQTALDNVQGTEDLIRSCKDYSVSKVVVTSSMAAVRGTGQSPKNGNVYTHEDWNTLSELGKNWGQSYQWSKAESERRAWDLCKEFGIPMVSLCPAFVFGPPRDKTKWTSSYSVKLVRQWLLGESTVQSRLLVDVRDVARAHVEAGWLAPNAEGNRYIVSTERRITSSETGDALKKAAEGFPDVADVSKITCDLQFDGGAIKIGDQEVECIERMKQNFNGLIPRHASETMEEMAQALLEFERSKL